MREAARFGAETTASEVAEGIDLVVFRENTEGMYAGVEFHPIPDDVRQVLEARSPAMKKFSRTPADEMAITLRIITRDGARNRYEIDRTAHLRHPLFEDVEIGPLIDVLQGQEGGAAHGRVA